MTPYTALAWNVFVWTGCTYLVVNYGWSGWWFALAVLLTAIVDPFYK